MKKTLTILLGLSFGVNITLTYKNSTLQEEVDFKSIEILNLRGYKYAYIDLVDKADTIHANCLRGK